jgi:uncharacterized protein
MHRKKIIFVLLGFFIFLISLYFVFKKDINSEPDAYVKINGTILEVETAKTNKEHYMGLSNRDEIKDDWGMLFIFENKEERSFVMRDMMFSLDIVFISEDTIVTVYKNTPFSRESQNILYKSLVPVDKVLELKGGLFDYYNFKIGDKVEIF